jgi:hypothetical protein
VICIALILGLAAWRAPELTTLASPLDLWVGALAAVILGSLVLEIIYAWGFFRLVGARTTGHDGVWFASNEDPGFRRLVRLTAFWNVPLYLFLAVFLWMALFGGAS